MRLSRDWSPVIADISKAGESSFRLEKAIPVAGGSINSAYRLEGGGVRYFVKTNSAERLDMFAAEAEGLTELAGASAIRVPRPIACGADASGSWLVCEFIPFGGRQGHSEQLFGEQLAALHHHTAAQYGWPRHNTIGSTFQDNSQTADWISFFRDQRLQFQMKLAGGQMGPSLQADAEELLITIPGFFSGYTPAPSLLHGDLWGGNCAFDQEGAPVIFDPAVYYGDREADLAMTELFGGFGAKFYAAYRGAWPLDQGYAVRKTLYNLYHVLNHANLFGGGYLHQAESMIGQLLAEVR
ncbi:MAG TPA: fructosamine kinase family protein [Mariprofundaceae bacterium]|nr:fructosamine kinase family protein [Mariprofundaceae bacterium]